MDQALSRLVKEKALRRLGRGLFDVPRINPTLGIEISPDPDRVAEAIARKRAGRVRPSGAFAANALGLTTQVPGRRVYLTDTASQRVRVGNQTLTFKRVAPKSFGTEGGPTSAVLQALQFLGKDGVTDEIIDRIRSLLSAKDKKKLLRDSRYVTGWIAEAARRAASD